MSVWEAFLNEVQTKRSRMGGFDSPRDGLAVLTVPYGDDGQTFAGGIVASVRSAPPSHLLWVNVELSFDGVKKSDRMCPAAVLASHQKAVSNLHGELLKDYEAHTHDWITPSSLLTRWQHSHGYTAHHLVLLHGEATSRASELIGYFTTNVGPNEQVIVGYLEGAQLMFWDSTEPNGRPVKANLSVFKHRTLDPFFEWLNQAQECGLPSASIYVSSVWAWATDTYLYAAFAKDVPAETLLSHSFLAGQFHRQEVLNLFRPSTQLRFVDFVKAVKSDSSWCPHGEPKNDCEWSTFITAMSRYFPDLNLTNDETRRAAYYAVRQIKWDEPPLCLNAVCLAVMCEFQKRKSSAWDLQPADSVAAFGPLDVTDGFQEPIFAALDLLLRSQGKQTDNRRPLIDAIEEVVFANGCLTLRIDNHASTELAQAWEKCAQYSICFARWTLDRTKSQTLEKGHQFWSALAALQLTTRARLEFSDVEGSNIPHTIGIFCDGRELRFSGWKYDWDDGR